MEQESAVRIEAAGAVLAADQVIPAAARGVVLFAHGSGSSRRSPRNRMVAERLQQARFATVLADLLTDAEDRLDAQTGQLRFDIGLLAHRLVGMTDWLGTQEAMAQLPVGLFGASTGAAAALAAAARRPAEVHAVVSRGGRPDLAGSALAQVKAPTLLIVGGADEVVLELNQQAAELLPGEAVVTVIPGASHLFPEPGALEQVADHAADWFTRHL